MDLTDYVKSNLEHGYSTEQIKSYLVSKGYSENDVNDAISKASSNQQPQPQNNQVEQLESYILNSLGQNYQPQQIYDYLLTQNYKKSDVIKAFKKIDKERYNGKMPLAAIHNNNSALIKIVITFLLVILIGFGTFMFLQTEDTEIEPTTPNIVQNSLSVIVNANKFVKLGDNFLLDIKTNAKGTSDEVTYDFTFRNDKGQLVLSESDSKTKSSASFKKTIQIPENIPTGNYEIEVVAKFDKFTETKKVSFTVNDESSQPEIEPNPESEPESEPVSDSPPTDSQSPDEVSPPVNPTKPSTTSVIINQGTSDQDLYELAQQETDKSKSIAYCENVDYTFLQEDCYSNVAQKYNDEGICLYLEESSRDYCYMNFILNGRSELCSLVTQDSTKTICLQYQQAEDAQNYQPTSDEENNDNPYNQLDDSDFDF